MGVNRYDRTVVAMAAENLAAGDSLDDIIARSYNVSETCLGNLGDAAFGRVPAYNAMYVEQGKIIRALAAKGGAVFLGRCADVILEGLPNVYSVFICADDNFRAARAKTEYEGMTLKQLDEIEQTRRHYYAFYTGKVWGDPVNYDLIVNAGKIPLEAAADLILAYVDLRQSRERT